MPLHGCMHRFPVRRFREQLRLWSYFIAMSFHARLLLDDAAIRCGAHIAPHRPKVAFTLPPPPCKRLEAVHTVQ
jgi:hypothetical protein